VSDDIYEGEVVDPGHRDENKRVPARELTPEQRKERLGEYALFVPRLIKLIARLMRDPRVPARSKATLVLVVGYVVSPVDIIPDRIPGFGRLDDIMLVAFALDQILNRIDERIVFEHWEGDEDVLKIIREILDISTGFMPTWMRRRFART
jgi:uncharacterized membrane protein YkvA (DUF1232 family)